MRRYTYAAAESVLRLFSALPRRDRELLVKAFPHSPATLSNVATISFAFLASATFT